MVDKELAIQMRRDGATFGEIGDVFGVSGERIRQILKNAVRARKCSTDLEKIPYKGIYEFMLANPRMTIPALAKLVYAGGNVNGAAQARRFLLGKNVEIRKQGIDRLIAKSGMTYEQLFELREGFCEEDD